MSRDDSEWERLKAKARALPMGTAAVAMREMALALGEVVRAIAKHAPNDAAKRAWMELQARKARKAAKARKLRAREERKRLRRAACSCTAEVAAARREAVSAAVELATAREMRRCGLLPDDGVNWARRRARDSAIVYAAHCAAVGAVPKVEA